MLVTLNYFTHSKQGRASKFTTSTMSLSKPLRKPRFRDWLIYILDNDLCSEDARWKDRQQAKAIIRWPHKSRGTWTLEKDAKLFKMWAITSGKYRANIDSPNPKSWKCNFRMNLNICRNIMEVKQERIPKGPNACRVFQFLGRVGLQHCSFTGFDGMLLCVKLCKYGNKYSCLHFQRRKVKLAA